ncbi:hypothetical protein J3A83DRAFT_4370634 [Scleroderma citrinum]
MVYKPTTALSKAPETFDLTSISENDKDEEEPLIPPPILRAQGDILMDTTRSAALDPLLTDTQTNSPGTPANVHFFFTKNKGEEIIDPTLHLTWMKENWSSAEVFKVCNVMLEKMAKYHSHGLVMSTTDFTQQATAPCPSQPLETKQQMHKFHLMLGSVTFYISNALPTCHDLFIQASSVPSECVFSSASETMTKCCNHISPILMEAIQMMKFFLKKEQLNFTKGWVMSQKDMQIAVTDNYLLTTIVEVVLNHDSLKHQIDDIIKAIGEDEGDEIDDDPALF